MNININYNSRTPIYIQIVSEIERLVSLNILKPDSSLPSIRELACTLGINPNTVKKAYDILESKEIIITKSTKGTFVSSDTTKAKEIKINELINKMQAIENELISFGLTKEEIIKKLNSNR